MHDDRSATTPAGVDLHRLPALAPDPALWARVQVARTAQLRSHRRWRNGLALTTTVAAAVGVAILLAPQVEPLPPVPSAIAADQRESRDLQAEWLRVSDGAVPARPASRLRAIDASLQAAYDRGAEEEELAPLWQQRNRALRGLIDRVGDGDIVAGITRI